MPNGGTNERLYEAGLLVQFNDAVKRQDGPAMRELLWKIGVTGEHADRVVDAASTYSDALLVYEPAKPRGPFPVPFPRWLAWLIAIAGIVITILATLPFAIEAARRDAIGNPPVQPQP